MISCLTFVTVYLIDEGTMTIYVMYYHIKYIDLCKYMLLENLTPAWHFRQVRKGARKHQEQNSLEVTTNVPQYQGIQRFNHLESFIIIKRFAEDPPAFSLTSTTKWLKGYEGNQTFAEVW